MADTLQLAQRSRYSDWSIQWVVEIGDGEYDEGATLGESGDRYTEADLAKAKPENWDHVCACVTASKTAGVKYDKSDGYTWELVKDAKAALRAVKLAIKMKSGKPLPEWAVKASAEGWKPPKGWKP